MQRVLEPILLMEAGPRVGRLWIEVPDRVRAAELEGDDVVDLVVAGRVAADAIAVGNRVFRPLRDVADALRVARPADPVGVGRRGLAGRAGAVGQAPAAALALEQRGQPLRPGGGLGAGSAAGRAGPGTRAGS